MSVSFAASLGEAVRTAASEAGRPLSTWLAEAAATRLRTEALAAFLSDWEREHGAITPADLARAESDLSLRTSTPAV